MIRKPPRYVYGHNITVRVCNGIDRWQNPSWDEISLSGVNVQSTNETRRTADNTEVVMRSIIFVDSLYSTPHLDLEALKAQSEENGAQMTIVFNGQTYTVISVDALDDERCRLDHYEVGCI